MFKSPQSAAAPVCSFHLLNVLNQSPLACIEIGLSEIESAAGREADQISLHDFTKVTEKAMQKRPEHVADILLVSSWMLAEVFCTEAQRDVVRQHWMAFAQTTEIALQ